MTVCQLIVLRWCCFVVLPFVLFSCFVVLLGCCVPAVSVVVWVLNCFVALVLCCVVGLWICCFAMLSCWCVVGLALCCGVVL